MWFQPIHRYLRWRKVFTCPVRASSFGFAGRFERIGVPLLWGLALGRTSRISLRRWPSCSGFSTDVLCALALLSFCLKERSSSLTAHRLLSNSSHSLCQTTLSPSPSRFSPTASCTPFRTSEKSCYNSSSRYLNAVAGEREGSFGSVGGGLQR